mmetsp:Transcript_7143/g.14587  ORF Transcript_7143/g.14587 Transcript_7143/m.14587 type:complete len:1022 (-) Transcript_7143:2207-5272(-)
MNGYADGDGETSSEIFANSSNGSSPNSRDNRLDDTRRMKNSKPEMVMEGWMLKRSRNNYWQDRYFVFQSDQSLSYWHKKTSSNSNIYNNNNDNDNGGGDGLVFGKDPTASFTISRQAGCEIGDVYVEKRSTSSSSASSGKESLYCIDILWTEEAETVITAPPSFRRTLAAEDSAFQQQQTDDEQNYYINSTTTTNNNNNNNWETSSVNSSSSRRRKKPFLRRRLKRRKSASDNSNPGGDKMLEYYSNQYNDFPSAPNSPAARPYSGGPISPMSEVHGDTSNNRDGGAGGSHEFTTAINKTKSEDNGEQEKLHNQFFNKQRKKRSVKTKRLVDATKVAVAAGAAVGVGVVTVGVGLAAGLVFLGGAAATAGVAEAGLKRTLKKKDSLTIATTDYKLASVWKTKLDACLEQEYIQQSTWAQRFAADGGKTASALIPHDVTIPDGEDEYDITGKTNNQLDNLKSNLFFNDPNILAQETTKWKPLEDGWGIGAQSLRIFKEEKIRDDELSMKVSSAGGDDSSCTPLKTQLVLNAHPAETFMCIMSYARISPVEKNTEIEIPMSPNSGQAASYRLVEKIDDHRDVLHLVCRPLYLFPTSTTPRDFVVIRYWRYDPEGSYIICYESTEHAACPPQPGFVRGTMHQVYTIAPPKNNVYRRKSPHTNECMLTAVVQVDPKGWIPTRPIVCQSSNQTYADGFGVSALLQTLDIRDAIENDRFLDLTRDMFQHPQQPPSVSQRGGAGLISNGGTEEPAAYDARFVNRQRVGSFTEEKFPYVGKYPAPLSAERWAEPDPNSFLVRGPNYLNDGVKISGSSIGQLIAMDCVLVDKPILTGMSIHPTERIQQALKREREFKERGQKCDTPPFMFVINIVVPAAQCFHAVFYYAVDDMSTIDGSDGTPSSRLCEKFLFGDSDEFRDQTFKLIPRIVEGNFLVRKAVGSTPAIMGTRLKQYYVRNERFMEIVLDCGSSQVAEGVLKLSLGYAKTLVVDMGFILEAVEEEHLPERLFGSVRVKYPSFGNELRKVDPP